MNLAMLSGYVKSVSFRGSAKDRSLCADVVMSVVDDIRPDFYAEIHFTVTGNAKKWREVGAGDFVEVRGKLLPAVGLTKDGNRAHEVHFMPQGVRVREQEK